MLEHDSKFNHIKRKASPKNKMKLNSSHQPMTILLWKLNLNNKDLAYYNKGVLHP
jgi:hypothetical protein